MKYGVYIGISPEAVKAQSEGVLKLLKQLDTMRATPRVQLAALNSIKVSGPENTTIDKITVNGDFNED